MSKIDECDLFVADVSIINPGTTERECPNPNVMYELGYAVATKGQDNIVLIANKTTTNTADLPFDIRNRRMVLREFSRANKAIIEGEFAEIMRNHRSTSPTVTPSFELLQDRDGWANWGGDQQGSGFRYLIRIDNFGASVDFIDNIKVTTSDDQGSPWSTTHFKFDNHAPNEKLKIEENEIKDVWVFLTDQPGTMQRLMPDIDQDTVNIIITLRSDGRQINLPVTAAHLVNR